MKPAALPIDEMERLSELVRYHILDTEEEKDYNDVVQLAADICNCPISSITFVDAKRQWFKASINMPDKETSRDVSFCSHAILQDEVMVVPDATEDERFHDYPNVTGGILIRFYAGAPIVSQRGKKLGTLCVIDTKKRKLDPSQKHALQTMAGMVSRLLELRVSAKHLVDTSEKVLKSAVTYKELFDYSNVAQWIYDLDSKAFIAFNRAASSLYGYSLEEFPNLRIENILNPEKTEVKRLFEEQVPRGSLTFVSAQKRKDRVSIMVESTLSRVSHNGNRFVVATIVDLSEKLQLQKDLIDEKKQFVKEIENAAMSAQLKERKFIGKELHDNISQMLSSTNIYLDIAFSDEEMRLDLIRKSKENLLTTMNHIRSLSRRLVTNGQTKIDLIAGIKELLSPYQLSGRFLIHLKEKGDVAEVPEALKTSLLRIVQEALHNIEKYASAKNVWIDIQMKSKLKLEVRDDGVGFDPAQKSEGIGLRNMRERAETLGGKFSIESGIGRGTTISLTLPVMPE